MKSRYFYELNQGKGTVYFNTSFLPIRDEEKMYLNYIKELEDIAIKAGSEDRIEILLPIHADVYSLGDHLFRILKASQAEITLNVSGYYGLSKMAFMLLCYLEGFHIRILEETKFYFAPGYLTEFDFRLMADHRTSYYKDNWQEDYYLERLTNAQGARYDEVLAVFFTSEELDAYREEWQNKPIDEAYREPRVLSSQELYDKMIQFEGSVSLETYHKPAKKRG